MARFSTLCSSSSGNSAYIGTSEHGILIDAGTNNKQLLISLEKAGLSPDSIKAIFLTHEHDDHVGALKIFASKRKIPVYATGGTLSGLMGKGLLDGSFQTEKITGDGVTVEDMHISFFHTFHDSKESCGYTVELPDAKVGVCTDTGKVSDEILKRLSDCSLVLLESNYDDTLLDFSSYPLSLKARIRSEHGHLSNKDCAATARALFDSGVRRFVLGHLSRENNTPDRAFAYTNSVLKRDGAVAGRDYLLEVAPVSSMGKYIIF